MDVRGAYGRTRHHDGALYRALNGKSY
jgi:hypothetical protein